MTAPALEVLVLAPRGRDAALAVELLSQAGIAAMPVADLAGLLAGLVAGAGSAVVAEEAFAPDQAAPLVAWVAAQPAWSDLPFVVLTRRDGATRDPARLPPGLRALSEAGNVSFLERPFHKVTFLSQVRAALRARARQYEARASLEAQARAASALAESEARFRSVANHAPVLIWVGDAAGGGLWVNRPWLDFTQAGPAQVQGAGWLDVVHPQDRDAVRAALARLAGGAGPQTLDLRLRRFDGAWRVVSMTVAPRGPAGAEMSGAIACAVDVTEMRDSAAQLEAQVRQRTAALERVNAELVAEAAERAQAEAKLRQSQKMEAVGQLTGGIAHDFNNLLTAVMGSLELIQSRTKEERSRQLAGHGLAAVARGTRLIRQLLTFSRVQRLELAPVACSELIAGMHDLVEGCLAPGMALHMQLAEDLPPAVADPHELELAVLNLAINARDAMTQGGTLRIATALRIDPVGREALRLVVISVSDTGQGMSPETMERAFEPFYTTKEAGRGSGLGLSQVYGLAQQSGGRVGLRSQPGVGTTVEILLPAAESTEAISAVLEPAASEQATS